MQLAYCNCNKFNNYYKKLQSFSVSDVSQKLKVTLLEVKISSIDVFNSIYKAHYSQLN